MKIYTGRGDDGFTSLIGGARVAKYDPQPEAYGTLDEASAALGFARAIATKPEVRAAILEMQRALYRLMAELATVEGKTSAYEMTEADVTRVEELTNDFTAQVPVQREFVVPGDTMAGAALDVFSQEPIRDDPILKQLVAHERVIATPHLGASTEEAQVGVATDVAEQVVAVLHGGFPRAAVNAPLILPETLKILQPYMALVEKLGRLYTQLQPGPLNKIELAYSGDIASYDLRPLQAALIKGLLEPISDAHVNMINAHLLAKQWGLEITEQKSPTPSEFANLVTLRVLDGNGRVSSFAGKPGSGDEHVEILSGTVMHGEPRIVRVGHYWTEFIPAGHILFCRNLNQPGMIGRVGTVLGKANVNIRHMDVGPITRKPHAHGPDRTADTALMIVSVDEPIPDWALQEISASGDIFGLTMVKL